MPSLVCAAAPHSRVAAPPRTPASGSPRLLPHLNNAHKRATYRPSRSHSNYADRLRNVSSQWHWPALRHCRAAHRSFAYVALALYCLHLQRHFPRMALSCCSDIALARTYRHPRTKKRRHNTSLATTPFDRLLQRLYYARLPGCSPFAQASGLNQDDMFEPSARMLAPFSSLRRVSCLRTHSLFVRGSLKPSGCWNGRGVELLPLSHFAR